jgi:hypothetical protein
MMLFLILTRQRHQHGLAWIFFFWTIASTSTAFSIPRTTTTTAFRFKGTDTVPGALFAISPDNESWDLTAELTAYLTKRTEQGADEAAKA